MNFSWQVLEMTLEFSDVQLKQRGTRTGPTMAFFFEKMSDDEWLAGTLVLGWLGPWEINPGTPVAPCIIFWGLFFGIIFLWWVWGVGLLTIPRLIFQHPCIYRYIQIT